MKQINLKTQYPQLYKTDTWIEVSDEVANFLVEDARKQHAYAEQIRYHKAYYSLDAGDGIENQAEQGTFSMDDFLSASEFFSALSSCIDNLPNTQKRRVYLHLILGLQQNEIAQLEGVAKSSVSESIHRGIAHIRKIFIHPPNITD